MNKEQLKNGIELVSIMGGCMGKHMKFEGDDLKRVVTDEEKTVLHRYAALALAIGQLSKAIDDLPD